MDPRSSPRSQLRRRVVVALVALGLVLAGLALTVPRSDAGAMTATHHGPAATTSRALTASQLALHDQMRKLWEDHVTWTRLAIVTFADGSAGFDATAEAFMSNLATCGNCNISRPFLGNYED